MLVSSEFEVTVTTEGYTAQGSLIESTLDHVSLACKFAIGGCKTEDGTYILESDKGCSMEIIQSFTGVKTI